MKKYLKLLSAIALVTGLSSCLKDEPIIGGKPQNIVEFLTTSAITSSTSSPYPFYTQSFDVTPSGSFDVILSYSGSEVAPQDITVDIGLAPEAVTKINTPIKKAAYDAAYADAKDAGYSDADAAEYAQGEADAAGYTMMPTDIYSLSSTTAVIKKGQRRSEPIKVTVKPDMFDFTLSYALPLTIKSSSFGTVSGNFATVIYNIGAKNAYDGVYNYKSAANQSLNPGANENGAELTTIDATHVSTNLVNTYANIVIYEVDPATNKITVTNSGGIGAATTDPSSHWDPATKVFYVKWKTSNRQFEETYTYTGPRS